MPRNTLNGTRTVLFDSGTTTGFCTTSPGVSVVPANALPSITVSPPKSSAWTKAPWRLTPPSAMSGTRPAAALARLDERLHLRDAEVRVQPRRASASGPDADLDAVDAALGEEADARGGGHVAGDQFHAGEALSERLDGSRHHRRMAVRDVDDDHVDLGANQLRRPLEIVSLRPDRGPHAEPSLLRRASRRGAAAASGGLSR